MTKITSFVFAPFAVALGLSMLALPMTAQETDTPVNEGERPSPWQHFGDRYDTNGDGVVSREEFQAADRRFERLDSNGDGQITEDEFPDRGGRFGRRGRHGRHDRGAGIVAAADTDENGSVTSEEWRQFTAVLDTNGDGAVSEEELRTFHEVRVGEGFKARGPRGGRGVGPMKRFDTDENGTLDAAEQESLFKSLDADGDGEVTAEEMPRARRGPRGGRGGRGPGPGFMLLGQADADQDGQLTSAEWQGFLAGLDVDSDGSLSRQELEAVRPEGAPGPPAGAPALELSRLQELFSRLDENGDGVISEDERPRRRFRGPRGR